MLALYIFIVLDRNIKQNVSIFFCVELTDNLQWINDFNVTLYRIGLAKCKNMLEKKTF